MNQYDEQVDIATDIQGKKIVVHAPENDYAVGETYYLLVAFAHDPEINMSFKFTIAK